MTDVLILRASRGNHASQYVTSLPDGTVLHTGSQCARPAARKLLDMGYDPQRPMTVHFAGAVAPSSRPRPIIAWAMERLTEGDRGFSTGKWAPHPRATTPDWYTAATLYLSAYDDATKGAA